MTVIPSSDPARATRASLSGRYDVTDALTIGAAGFWQQTDADTDGDYPVLEDGADASNSITRGLRVHADYDSGGIRHILSAQRSETSRQEIYDGVTYPYDGTRSELDYKGSTDVNPQVSLAWGASHSQEDFKGDGVDSGYITNALFSEFRYAPNDRLDLAVSLRNDHNSQFGGKTTGRVAMAWRPDDRWTLRAQWGTGYRAPSLYELYGAWVGTPDLRPETAKGGEIGAEYAFQNGGFLRGTMFQNTITDLIDYSFSSYVYEQFPGDTRTRGVELSGETPLGDTMRLSGNFTYTDSKRPDGQPLDRVPARVLNLRLDHDVTTRARYGLGLTHVSGLRDDDAPMPSYTVVDALVEYDLTDQVAGYLRVENLFDEDYQVLRGYGTSDRAIYAGIRADF